MVISDLRKELLPTVEKNDLDEIIFFVLGIDRTKLLSNPNLEISRDDAEKIRKYTKELQNGRPLQYILGFWEFDGFKIKVNEDVLIPRDDTMCLVEAAKREIRKGMKILDLCTGSGCISVSLCNFDNSVFATAVDLYDGALSVAEENLRTLTNGNYKVVRADVLKAPKLDEKFDIIVSNPPYIQTDVIPTLDENVKHEPITALDGGKDGLDFYKSIAKYWSRLLKKEGKIVFEIGYDEGEMVSEILSENGFEKVRIFKDLSGNDRAIIGTYIY